MRRFFILLLFVATAHADPRLFFSDLTAGPKTGGENNKGAYVCVFGEGFGGTRGTSTITVNGGAVDNYPVWGATWLWYQKSCFQLGSGVSTGDIVMHVGGIASNGLAFTVNSASIFFVDQASGNNANDGSFATPWKEAWYAKDFMGPNNISYLRAGTWSDEEPGFPTGNGDGASCLAMDNINDGNIVGYPGETATIACDRSGAETWDVRLASHPANNWTFADIDFGGTFGLEGNISWENTNGGDNLRFVGNKIHGSTGPAMVMQGSMDGNNILGNNIYDYWSLQDGANEGERGYGLYFGGYGTQQNINVKWNRFNQNQGDCYGTVNSLSTGNAVTWVSGCDFTGLTPGRRIVLGVQGNFAVATVVNNHSITVTTDPGTHTNVYPYISGGNNGTKGIQMYGHLSGDLITKWIVANNEFWNNCREAISAGGSDGGTPIFPDADTQLIASNLFVDNGFCDVNFGYSALTVQSGVLDVFNNDFYKNGNSPQISNSGDINNQSVTSLVLTNNAFVAPDDTSNYCGYVCMEGGGSTTQITGNTNSFLGFGNGGAYLTGNLNATDPTFVTPTEDPSTADFHLQSGSPVKTGGTTETLAAPDKDGCSRPQGATYSLGPYEVGCVSTPPPPATVTYFPGRH